MIEAMKEKKGAEKNKKCCCIEDDLNVLYTLSFFERKRFRKLTHV